MKNKTDLNNFDLIRNVLSFLVFFTHWNILTANDNGFFLFHLSGIAIDMFFIASGFLIWWSYNADKNNSNFYIKRFFRVFPLYFIIILLQTIFFAFYSNGSMFELFKYFLVNLVFLNFLSPTVGDILASLQVNAINGSLWTLKNEVMFYLLVPIIFKIYNKFGIKALYLVYVLSLLYAFYFFYLNDERMLVQFPAQMRLFLSGIFIFIFFDKIGKYKPKILATVCVILVLLFRDNEFFRFTVYPFALSLILIYLVYYIRPFIIKFDISYSFYIIHFPLIQLAILSKLNPSNPLLSFVLLFSLTVLLSYVSEIYIEKRFVKLGRAIINKKRLREL